jgi:hypothetical protein
MSESTRATNELPLQKISHNDDRFPWWVSGVVVLGVILLIVGSALAILRPQMLVSPQDEINGAARVFAGYFASRNLALAILLLSALVFRNRGMLNNLVLLTAFIQVLDAATDCLEGRWSVLPGVILLGVAFFAAAARISGQPFWKAQAWKGGLS